MRSTDNAADRWGGEPGLVFDIVGRTAARRLHRRTSNLARWIRELVLLSSWFVCNAGCASLELLGQPRALLGLLLAMRLRAAFSKGSLCYARHCPVPVNCQLEVCSTAERQGEGMAGI